MILCRLEANHSGRLDKISTLQFVAAPRRDTPPSALPSGTGSCRGCICDFDIKAEIFILSSPSSSLSLNIPRRTARDTLTMSAPPATLLPIRNHDEETPRSSAFSGLSKKASEYHARVPYISKLPFPAIAIIVALIVVNLVVWAAVGVVLVYHTRHVLSAKD